MKDQTTPQQLLHFLKRTISPAVQKQYIENIRHHEKLVYAFEASGARYEVVDMIYGGRPARVLFSGHRQAAQSGIALDDKPELLFDYNQRFMELIDSLQPSSVLLIGGGAYTLPNALLRDNPGLHLTIVEPETGFSEPARRFFDWKPSAKTKLIHADGRTFFRKTRGHYDLILIDAFSHTTIPSSLLDPAAITQFKQHLKPNGAVAMNLISPYYGRGSSLIVQQYERYSSLFKEVTVFPASRSLLSPWISQNYVLVAQAGPHIVKPKLRFEAMPPPEKK